MIKEAIDRILEVSNGKIFEAHGKSYSSKKLEPISSPENTLDPISVRSLDGFSDYANNSDLTENSSPKYVLIKSPSLVSLISSSFGKWNQRHEYINAVPYTNRSDFDYGEYCDPERFILAIRTLFVQDENTALILKTVGNLQAQAISTVVDDGFSQEAVVKKGITKVEKTVVPSPVALRPFRTFQEIGQPESLFVLRMRRDDDDNLPEVGLFEVCDNMWQVKAVQEIKTYLQQKIKDLLILA